VPEPRCPFCNTTGLQEIATQQLPNRVVIVYCRQCGAIHGVIPPLIAPVRPNHQETDQPPTPSPTPSPSTTPKQVTSNPIDEIGNADLTNKVPYSAERIADAMKSARFSHQTRYLKVAIEDGPPCCTRHKVEMKKITIPKEYMNAGRKVWVCPKYEVCKEWELAEDR